MVLFFARDAGAANVLAAVFPGLAAPKTFWAKDFARPVLDRMGIAHRDFNAEAADRPLGPADGEAVSGWLGEQGPVDLVVTGTTHRDDLTDRLIWEACAERGIPTVCFLDGWLRPTERFEMGGQFFRPDCIVAVDRATARLLEDRGLARERVTALAHPHLGRIFAARKELLAGRERTRARLRELFGRPFKELIVLASEPQTYIASLGVAYSENEFGEVELYEQVAGALDPARSRDRLTVVKLHPKEDGGSWAGSGADLIKEEIPALDLAAAADAVVGVKSMLLLEAVVLGRPVICLDWFTREGERLVTNGMGLSHPARDKQELSALLADTGSLKRPALEEIRAGFGLAPDYLRGHLELLAEYAGRRAA